VQKHEVNEDGDPISSEGTGSPSGSGKGSPKKQKAQKRTRQTDSSSSSDSSSGGTSDDEPSGAKKKTPAPRPCTLQTASDLAKEVADKATLPGRRQLPAASGRPPRMARPRKSVFRSLRRHWESSLVPSTPSMTSSSAILMERGARARQAALPLPPPPPPRSQSLVRPMRRRVVLP
jgi:hypothetical protein